MQNMQVIITQAAQFIPPDFKTGSNSKIVLRQSGLQRAEKSQKQSA